ncbi:hypothetical protein DICPUDRAFT_51794 [Dictyostelium purpureum]|uniref:Amino acid transporter transmembrane domain-containing protein n=1 Tax=Dictyostelium purpureum TaxID=5786 RepID=F1A5J9_DICPU|nr:uncharacterized protein DICPUDRAFT_51794 [Dictyostelium purpureum]EGC28531.1 hypothetical protein DICPUDRAFT_51794 [Dictyostelium purpureum]|eukprot:XP_003294943.1 hypothetical protein DICPUDRAFT_51794 [Dictyostelium purpureum]
MLELEESSYSLNLISDYVQDDDEIVLTKEHKEELEKSFGHKTIGFFGGVSLLIGNMTGPAMVSTSLVFQQGGWILSLLGFLVILFTSTLSGLFMVESMASIPGNPRFQLRVEFTMLCRFYFGKWGYIIAQIFINVALQATNVASIIICAQVMDSTLIAIFKKTCGLQMAPHVEWICETSVSADSSPFSGYMFFTIGYLVVLVIIIPLGFLNLDDNIIVQIIAVILMFTLTTSWIVTFCIHGLEASNLPTVGTKDGIAQIMGSVMFNYAYITTLPSWVNESKPTVNIRKAVWLSAGASTFVFVMVGIFGALAFANMPITSDILSVINHHGGNIITKISVYVFPFVVLASSIPVFSIVVRYNLMQNGLLPKWIANGIAVLLPWLIVIPFLTGNGLNLISNYSSIFFSSIANFVIPLLIYLKSLQFRRGHKKMTEEQRHILKTLIAETLDWEANQHLYTHTGENHNMFKVFTKLKRNQSKNIAIACLVILGVLIPLVIATTFAFPGA